MDIDEFRKLHSALIQQVQGIEYDLKLIYAAIKPGSFERNFKKIKNFNLGKIAADLRRLDYSDNIPDLSKEEYDLIEHIRVIRNYWCHECYVDFMYINGDAMRDEKFNQICETLQHDENLTFALFNKLEEFRVKEIKAYR